ncbi:cyclic nucleotide-binding domain-containing protein 2-like isoform X2 [Ptychodera flava]|uniref:cyclic nucleotide-binding domain-containing protein 2-like isoform X2 n=1 Tax=Ptychodera flava TaxID=63121 RepID=UPI00396A29FA
MSADIESDYSKQINPVSPSVLVPPSYQHDDRRRHQSPQQGQLQCTYNQHDDEADQIGRRNQRRRRSLFRSVPAAPQVNNWLRNAKSATLSAKSAAPRRHTMESVMPNAGPASQQRAAKQAPDGKGKQQQPHQQAGTAETASPRQSKVAVGTGKQQQRWNQNPAPDIQQVISTDVHKQLKIQAALQARERFQHAIKLVITLVRVFNMIQSRTEKEAQSRDYMTFTEIAEQFQSEDMKNSGLSFNPKDFKANREINISIEVKNILSMPSDQRTPEQLQTALYGLQTMKSFAEYPLHMQEKLTRVAWLEHIPPKKIIIRQGHYAEAFYFVISGSAVVTIMETNPNTGETKMRTATVLRKGSSFGELALLHHSVRTATVSSQGQVQLLAIGREDFLTSSCGVNDRAKSRNTSHSSGKSTA